MRISDWSSDVCSSDLAEQRLKPGQSGPGRALRSLQSVGERFWDGYKKSLSWALRHSRFMMLLLAITIGPNFYLYTVVQKGFSPSRTPASFWGFSWWIRARRLRSWFHSSNTLIKSSEQTTRCSRNRDLTWSAGDSCSVSISSTP